MKTAEVSELNTVALSDQITAIRVSPNSYFIALFLTTFITGFLVYLEKDYVALALFAASWIIFFEIN